MKDLRLIFLGLITCFVCGSNSLRAQTDSGLQLEAGGVAPTGVNLSYVHPIAHKTHWEFFLRAGAGLDRTLNRKSFFFPMGVSAEFIFGERRAISRLEFAIILPNTFAEHGTHYDFITFPLPQISYRARFGKGKHSIRAGFGVGVIPPDEDGWYPAAPWPVLGYAFHW